MALGFDEINDYISVLDDSTLTFPDSDWCIGLWTLVDSNTGSTYQYAISNGGFSSTNSFNLYLAEDSASGETPGAWVIAMKDSAGVEVHPSGTWTESSSAPGGDGTWRLIIVQRRSTQFEMWFCEPSATPSQEIDISVSTFADINSANPLNIGRRQDGNTARYFGGTLAEVFKGNFSLTSDQIAALGRGRLIHQFIFGNETDGQTLKLYLPLWDDSTTGVADMSGHQNNGAITSAPTVEPHAPVGTFFMTTWGGTLPYLVGAANYAISVSDTIAVSDSHTVEGLLLTVSESDTLALSDSALVYSDQNLAVSDTLAVSDAVSLDIPITGGGFVEVSVSDTLTLSDIDIVYIELSPNIVTLLAELIILNDTVSVNLENNIVVTDTIVLSDQAGANLDVTKFTAADRLILPLVRPRSL